MSKVNITSKKPPHFSPLEFTYTDSRGRKSGEPPNQPMGLSKAPRSRKKKSPKKQKDDTRKMKQADDLIKECQEEEDTTPCLPQKKRKYGSTVAERKERRTARKKKRIDEKAAVTSEKSKAAEVEKKSSEEMDYVEKENVSPQKSVLEEDLEFEGAECDFEQNSMDSSGERSQVLIENVNCDGSDTEDEDSPIKRRLFGKKRVIEETDEESGDEESDICELKSNSGGGAYRKAESIGRVKKQLKVVESDDEAESSTMGQNYSKTVAKTASSKDKSKKQSIVGSTNEDTDQGADDKRAAMTANKLHAHANPAAVTRRKAKTKSAVYEPSDESEGEMDELDFVTEEDAATNKVSRVAAANTVARANGKNQANAKASRQTARIIGKSSTAMSPYVQEAYAKAAAAAKKKEQIDFEDESETESEDELSCSKKRCIKKAKARELIDMGSEQEIDEVSAKKLKLPRAKKTTKTKVAAKRKENDDDSEYQPTQEVKAITRSRNNVATKTIKQKIKSDVVEKDDETIEQDETLVNKVTRSKRATAQKAAAKIKMHNSKYNDESKYQPTQGDLSFGGSNTKQAGARGGSKEAAQRKKQKQEELTSDDESSFVNEDKKGCARMKGKKARANQAGTKRVRGSGAAARRRTNKSDVTSRDDEADDHVNDHVNEEVWGAYAADDALFDEEQLDQHDEVHSPKDTVKHDVHVFTQRGDSNNDMDQELVSQGENANVAPDKRNFVLMSTRPISEADIRDLRAGLQKHTDDSEPTTPSHSSESKAPLSAVSLSNEKCKRLSESASSPARAIVVELLQKLETRNKLNKHVKTLEAEVSEAKEQCEAIEREINALASNAKLALARRHG